MRDYKEMLALISAILTTAPEFNKTGLVGFPSTPSSTGPWGRKAALPFSTTRSTPAQEILGAWAVLEPPRRPSAYVLSDDPESGWFGRDAMAAMPGFADTFSASRAAPLRLHPRGTTSSRQFRDGQRPIAAPEDNGVIVNACESAPYKLATDVKFADQFWIRASPIRCAMCWLATRWLEQFVGGTIHQAFSTLSYHRWHSPVSNHRQGRGDRRSYYSQPPGVSTRPFPMNRKGYITGVGRGLIPHPRPTTRVSGYAGFPWAWPRSRPTTSRVYVDSMSTRGDETGMFPLRRLDALPDFPAGRRPEFDLHGQEPGLESATSRSTPELLTSKADEASATMKRLSIPPAEFSDDAGAPVGVSPVTAYAGEVLPTRLRIAWRKAARLTSSGRGRRSGLLCLRRRQRDARMGAHARRVGRARRTQPASGTPPRSTTPG